MRQVTQMLLSELRAAPLLHNVGQPHTLSDPPIPSWDDAMELVRGETWSALQLMTKNRHAGVVNRSNWDRFQQWNAVAAALRPEVTGIAETSLGRARPAGEGAGECRASVAWDLLCILLEREFEDVVAPSFYVPVLLPVYQSGHLPCGWTGPRLDTDWSAGSSPLPAGNVLVY